MKHRSMYWKGLLACAALIALATSAFAVTEAEVVYIKNKLENRQQFTQSDLQLAQRINAETTSHIDLAYAEGLFKGTPVDEAPRRPRNPLDEYVVSETDMDWTDIVANGTPVPLGDDAQTLITIPFAFPYYESSYTTANLASNGYLAFGDSPFSSLSNVAIPSVDTPNGMIAMFWDDLDPDGGNAGNIYTFYDEANDRFIIQFDEVQHFPSGNPETFQCILYESGNIILQYESVSNASSCTIGIENLTGDDGIQICLNDGACVTAGSAWFLGQVDGVPNPPTNLVATVNDMNVTLTWDDPTHDTNGNPLTPNSLEILSNGVMVGSVGAGVETYTLSNLQSGNYTFGVRAVAGTFTGSTTRVVAVVGNPSYFSDFELDNGNLTPLQGWEWGTPTNGPTAAHSGVNCWGTLLTANYENAACYYLDVDQELTVASDAATMEFFMWQSCENFWDGMNIKVSTDGGTTWEIVQTVEPAYNEDAMNGNTTCHASEVAWSGDQSTAGWQEVVVNLGAYVGMTPIIRFSFGSDGSVQYPGFYIDDLTLWGFGEPEFATVSGTVTLDGGAGSVTAVSVQVNGIGNPVTNPLANGTYSFPNVLVGNRRVVGSLAGYHNASQDFVLTNAGATGINLTLVRVDPPVPTNLSGNVNSASGLVTLDWDNSTDPLVDVYPVYRRLQGEETWVLQSTPTASTYQQTLTVAGVYEYAVSARDNNVSTPVESDLTQPVTVLYGALPPVGLSARGNFDDRIILNWFSPGTSPLFELYYDSVDVDPTCVEDGLGFNAQFPFAWFAAHYEANGAATITRVKTSPLAEFCSRLPGADGRL
jgi:hypothetical protein